ncbi:MAG: hypothetical protein R2909_10625 [Gemmatimonadales bacterium]
MRSYPLALGLLAVIGLCLALNAIMTNTVLQTEAPDHLRGQVVALYAFIVIGLAPFGSAQASWVGERFGPSTAVAVGGAICLIGATVVAWRGWRHTGRATVAAAGPAPAESLPTPMTRTEVR